MVSGAKRISNKDLADYLAMISFIMFFNDEFVRNIIAKIFIIFDLPGYLVLSFLVMYMPLIFSFMLRPKKFKADMLFCILFVFVFFGITYIIHPEYEMWFFHREYSVANRVFRFDRAIYAYVFISISIFLPISSPITDPGFLFKM